MGVTIKDNLPALAGWVAAQKGGLIVLDGLPGAGKSTLARDLEASLDCLVVDADCFLVKERGIFIGALRVPELAAELRTALARPGVVLLASICARKVVELVGIDATAFIYVLLLTAEGEPDEKYALEAEEEFNLAELEGLSELDVEVRAYHWNYEPRRTADVIYYRTDRYELPPP